MDRQCLSFLLLLGLLTPPTHILPLGKAGRVDRGPLLPAGGFPGIPRPPGPAPSPSAPPPPPPPAGVALPLASSSGGGGESSGGRLLFAAAAGWIVSISLFSRSLARSLSSGEQAEASVCSRRVRKRRTRSERKRPPVVSAAPHGPAPEKEPAFGRAASAGRRRLSPAPAPPRGISGPPARLGGPGAMLTGGLGNA